MRWNPFAQPAAAPEEASIGRVIKRPDRPLPGVEVVELTERDSQFSLLNDFGVTQQPDDFADTVPMPLQLAEETEFDRIMQRMNRR